MLDKFLTIIWIPFQMIIAYWMITFFFNIFVALGSWNASALLTNMEFWKPTEVFAFGRGITWFIAAVFSIGGAIDEW